MIDKFIEWVLENKLYAWDQDKNEILYLAELKKLYIKFIRWYFKLEE